MKKTVPALVVCLLASLISSAQIKKGAHFIGGSIGISRTENETDPGNVKYETTNFQFSPAYGYAIKQNLIIGGDLVIQSGKNENNNNSQENNGFGAGFFVRKYLTLGKGFYLFGQGRFGVLNTKTTSTPTNFPNNATTNRQTSVGVSLFPGVSYAINNKLQLEIGLNDLIYVQYANGKVESGNSPVESTFSNFTLGSNLYSGAGLSVGLRILINN